MNKSTLAVFLLLCGAVAAFTNVTSCGTLSTNSETFNLTTNISNTGTTCLTLSASNAILYCNGFGIVGNNTNNTNGISITGSNNQILGCNVSGYSTAFSVAATNNTMNGVIGAVNSSRGGVTGTGATLSGNLHMIKNSTFYSFPPSYFLVYTASAVNTTIRDSQFYVNGSGGIYGFNYNQTYINNTIITNGSIGIQIAGGAVITYLIENNTITTASGTGIAIFTSGGAIQRNTIVGTGGIRISITSAASGNNRFILNNISCSAGCSYINDANGSNFYNGTYGGLNQGNLWQNIINNSLSVRGVSNSSISGYYIGISGNVPYNNSTSQGKFICSFQGCGDYAPLTNNFGVITTNLVSPANATSFYRAGVNITFNCSTTVYGSMNGAIVIDNTTVYNSTVLATTNTTFAYSASVGSHNWYVSCSNGTDINISTTRTFTRLPQQIVGNAISPTNNSDVANETQMISWRCNSTDYDMITTSLVFDGAVVVSGLSGVNLAQQNYTASLSLGKHSWAATCTDQSVSNSTGTNFFTRTGGFAISLLAPANNSNIYTTSYPFAWNVSGIVSNYLCNLTINGTIQLSNINSLNNSITNQTAAYPFPNNNTWFVTCWNGLTQNNSATRLFQAFSRPTCNVALSLYPTMNLSQNITATPSPTGNYTFYWTDFYGNIVETLSTDGNFTVNSTYNSTRIYIYANASNDAMCSNYTLVFSSKQTTVQNDLFTATITSFYNGYQDIILGIFAAGIGFGITGRIGHACLVTSIMWATIFLLFGSTIFLYGAIVMLVVGLLATYGRV